MRIAMLAPIAWRTPPRHYGPWELVTSLLTEALVARGVDVTLFATLDSQTSGTLDGIVPAPYEEDPSIDAKVWEYRHLSHLFSQADRFDIIHNQADFPAHAFSQLVKTPMVTTIHGFSSERILPMYKPFEDRIHYVAISEADRHPDLRYAATIHHGIRIDEFPLDAIGSEDLLFFGRMHPDKGASEAIAAARLAERRLHMYGVVQDRGYFEREVLPYVDGERVLYHGTVGGEARLRALSQARALLHLVNFEEPFGLSVVEAMACGTPVIAARKGSMSELIREGVNGAIVGGVEEAAAAVERVATFDRAGVRASVEQRFSVDRMADEYLALYRRILGTSKAGERPHGVIGWKLDRRQRADLLETFPPRYANAVADHVTLATGVEGDAPLPDAVSARIIGFADDGAGVLAMVVEVAGGSDRPDGGTFHITWSLEEGRHPRESNDVIGKLGWTGIEEPVALHLTPARFR